MEYRDEDDLRKALNEGQQKRNRIADENSQRKLQDFNSDDQNDPQPSHDFPFFKPKGNPRHQNVVKLKPTEGLSVENGSIEITDFNGSPEDVAERKRIQSTWINKPPKDYNLSLQCLYSRKSSILNIFKHCTASC